MIRNSKVIDIHVHIGTAFGLNMNENEVLDSMNQYGIDFALVSNADGCECDAQGKIYELSQQKNQSVTNLRTVDFAKKNPDKLGVMLWCKPWGEKIDNQFDSIYQENADIIYGLKVHPQYSNTKFNDNRLDDYIQFAQKYDLPILVHTAYDGYSNPEYVYDCACKYKGVRFIMSHLGLRKECDECISYLAERDNLFCDIAWVAVDTTLKVISMVGDKKIMYGSDNPTKGLMTYAYPFTNRIYLNDFQKLVNQETYRKIMRDNAINIFHLKEI